jgi:hypothetical protein
VITYFDTSAGRYDAVQLASALALCPDATAARQAGLAVVVPA